MALSLFSFFLSVAILLIIANYSIQSRGLVRQSSYFWTVYETHYSRQYLYWSKSYCEKEPRDCRYSEEQVLTHKVEVFTPPHSQQLGNCKKILFLGDSFTVAPWTTDGNSYVSQVSRNLAAFYNVCVKQFRLATGGVGTDQEFERFMDVVDVANPDIVIWQFYKNDLYENIKLSLYAISRNTLSRRSVLRNSLFLAGYANQQLPYLRDTSLGRYIMYMGENQDIFRYWETDLLNRDAILSYNEIKIPLFLKEIEKLSFYKGFKVYTTLAPLECQFVDYEECTLSGWQQDVIRKILQDNSNYISMERFGIYSKQILGAFTAPTESYARFFNAVDDRNTPGARHLSEEGNLYFGNILFANLVSL